MGLIDGRKNVSLLPVYSRTRFLRADSGTGGIGTFARTKKFIRTKPFSIRGLTAVAAK